MGWIWRDGVTFTAFLAIFWQVERDQRLTIVSRLTLLGALMGREHEHGGLMMFQK